MHSFAPPRSAAPDRNPAHRQRAPLVRPRSAHAPSRFSLPAGARREAPAPRSLAAGRSANGLPEKLRTVMEAMSGFSLAGVVVHRNSAEPARLGAAAFTKGGQIHLAPGQERHLPHEAWHVVQQAQGRVRPTLQLKGGVKVNDDDGLEREADEMGGRAAAWHGDLATAAPRPAISPSAERPIQRRQTVPTPTNAAALAGPATVANTDPVSIGPTNLLSYTVRLANAVASRDAALAAARSEYRSVGHSLHSVNPRFLAKDSLSKPISAQNPIAAVVYDAWLQAGIINAAPQQQPSDKQKGDALKAQGYADLLTPANLELLRNKNGLPVNDPVKVVIEAPYPNDGVHTLSMTADFTEGQKGYVSKVADTGSNVTAAIQDRPNYAGEFPAHALEKKSKIPGYTSYYNAQMSEVLRDFGGKQGPVVTFSSVHHSATEESAATQIANVGQNTTRAAIEGGLDAMTKIVAEGGRFLCVEALGTAIRNTSIFYAVRPQGGFRAIKFRDLWNRWMDPLGGAYGVTNQAVSDYLLGELKAKQGMEQLNDEPAATGYHYNLTTGQVR